MIGEYNILTRVQSVDKGKSWRYTSCIDAGIAVGRTEVGCWERMQSVRAEADVADERVRVSDHDAMEGKGEGRGTGSDLDCTEATHRGPEKGREKDVGEAPEGGA